MKTPHKCQEYSTRNHATNGRAAYAACQAHALPASHVIGRKTRRREIRMIERKREREAASVHRHARVCACPAALWALGLIRGRSARTTELRPLRWHNLVPNPKRSLEFLPPSLTRRGRGRFLSARTTPSIPPWEGGKKVSQPFWKRRQNAIAQTRACRDSSFIGPVSIRLRVPGRRRQGQANPGKLSGCARREWGVPGRRRPSTSAAHR